MYQEHGQQTWLGKGFGFPVTINESKKDLAIAEYEEKIRQSILIILGTAKGERVMRPDFGCDIYDLVFESRSPATESRISQLVQDSLLFFEPRITVRNVYVQSESDSDGEKLLINISYQVRATNNVFNLVYPFYLERSPG
jgi:phage baseplate assembly protein W